MNKWLRLTPLALIAGLSLCGCQERRRDREAAIDGVKKSWAVWDVSFSPNGHWLAAGRGYRDNDKFWPEGGDGGVDVWDVQDWKKQNGFAGPFTYLVGAIAFSPDSKNLIAASNNYFRFKRDPRAGKRDGRGRLIVGAPNPWGGHNVFLWKVPDGTISQHWKIDKEKGYGLPESLAISMDGKLLALGRGNTVPVLQIETGRQVYELEGINCWVGFSPNGKTLVAASRAPSIYSYDAVNGKKLATLDLKGGEPTCLRFSPDGKELAVSVSDGSVHLLAADLSRQQRSLEVSAERESVVAVAYAAKADLLAAATTTKVRLFEASSGKQLREWGKDGLRVSSVALSPNGKLLAVGYGGKHDAEGEYRGGYVKVWDTTTGRLVKKLD